MKYRITGNTYKIKDNLKAYGCTWEPDNKAWITPELLKNEQRFKALKSLTTVHNADMNPVSLSPECQTIQDIITR